MPFVQAGAVKLHYITKGTGAEPLVFIHGYTSSHRNWEELWPHLPAGYTAYAFDLRGAGESDKPDQGYNPAIYAADIDEATRQLGLDTFTLIGHSMGGGTAMQFAAAYPTRLRRVVFVAPISSGGIQVVDLEFRAQQRAIRDKIDLRLAIARATAVRPTPDATLRRRIEDELRWPLHALDEAWEGMVNFRLTDKMAALSVPALMLAGDRDGLRAANLEDAQRIPNCSLQVFYRVGHEVAGDAPAAVMTAIDDFCRHGAGGPMTMAQRRAIMERIVSSK